MRLCPCGVLLPTARRSPWQRTVTPWAGRESTTKLYSRSGSQGVTPAALVGTVDFDVTTIDVATLALEGVPPTRSSLEDVSRPVPDPQGDCPCTPEGPDGHLDLTLTFDTQELVAALGPVVNREERLLSLTGALLDGTPFQAGDCVHLRVPGVPPVPVVTGIPGSVELEISWEPSESPDRLFYAVYRTGKG